MLEFISAISWPTTPKDIPKPKPSHGRVFRERFHSVYVVKGVSSLLIDMFLTEFMLLQAILVVVVWAGLLVRKQYQWKVLSEAPLLIGFFSVKRIINVYGNMIRRRVLCLISILWQKIVEHVESTLTKGYFFIAPNSKYCIQANGNSFAEVCVNSYVN